MKLKTLLSILVVLVCCGTDIARCDDTRPDTRLLALMQDYRNEKAEQLIELNKVYIKKLKAHLKQAMREEDLAAANRADAKLKLMEAGNDALIKEQESAELIASLVGRWELATTHWPFEIFPDGRVWPLTGEPQRGRIHVVDLEKRQVRLTGFPATITWEIPEGSRTMDGTKHPARRIESKD